MSMCRAVSWVVGKECLPWLACSHGKSVSLCPASFCTRRPNLPVIPGTSWLYFCIPIPYDEKDILFFLVLVPEGVVSLHRTGQLQLLQHQWLGHRLGLLWCWMVCPGNAPRSFCHFWGCTQVLISDSFVDYEDCSISSQGFLSTVVDIMVTWIKFAYSCLF